LRGRGQFFSRTPQERSGGIRVIGEDHLIINNYIDAVEKGGFRVTAGVPNSALNAYFQAPNCVIVFNTFVDFRIARSVLAESGFSEEEHFDVLFSARYREEVRITRCEHSPLVFVAGVLLTMILMLAEVVAVVFTIGWLLSL
jgi:hypothetical protein